MNKNNTNNILIVGIILVISLMRFTKPLGYNFAPMNAIALSSGAFLLARWSKFLIPLLIIFISDVIINNTLYKSYFNGFTVFYDSMLWVYLSYILIVGLGMLMYKSSITVPKAFIGALSSSIIFFIVSNFGVWISSSTFPKTLAGLNQAYVQALPFFQNSLVSDLFFVSIIFGAYSLLQKKQSHQIA